MRQFSGYVKKNMYNPVLLTGRWDKDGRDLPDRRNKQALLLSRRGQRYHAPIKWPEQLTPQPRAAGSNNLILLSS